MQSVRAPCRASSGLLPAACQKVSEKQEPACTFLYASTCKSTYAGCRKALHPRSREWTKEKQTLRPICVAKAKARGQAKTSAKTSAANAESTTANEATNKASVTVSLRKEADFGFQYAIVGGDSALGEWDPSKAAVLDWSEGHLWSKTLDLPADSRVEYKFILVNNNMEAVDWQPGGNRIITTSARESTVEGQWEEPAVEEIPNQEALNGAPQSSMTSKAEVSDEDTQSPTLLSEVSEESQAEEDSSATEGTSAEAQEAPEGLVAEADIAPAATPSIAKAADAAAKAKPDVARPSSSSSPPSDGKPSKGFGLAGVSALVAVALLAAATLSHPQSATLIQKGDVKGAVDHALDRLNTHTETVSKTSAQLLSQSAEGLTKVTSGSLGGLSKATEGVSRAAGNSLGGLSKATGEHLAGLSKATEGLSKAAGDHIAKVTGDLTQRVDPTKVAMTADADESSDDVSSNRSAARIARSRR